MSKHGAGDLDRLVNILRSSEIRDESGQLVLKTPQPLHRKQPAMRKDVSGGETLGNGMVVNSVTNAIFMVRAIDDFKQTDQIEDLKANEVFDIVNILDREGDCQWQWVECSRVN